MGMLLLSAIGLLLSAALVFRAIRSGWWRAYIVVFCYFAFMTTHEILIWLIYWLDPRLYPFYYWASEGLFVALGFGLIWQVYAGIPPRYPGVGRAIRIAGQKLASTAPAFLVLAVFLSRRGTVTLEVVERNFRMIQAVLILIVFGLAAYYRIPLSRNLGAVARGFGVYTAVFIVRYSLGPLRSISLWQYLVPIGYTVSQIIWLAGLWHYETPGSENLYAAGEGNIETQSSMIHLWRELQRVFIHE